MQRYFFSRSTDQFFTSPLVPSLPRFELAVCLCVVGGDTRWQSALDIVERGEAMLEDQRRTLLERIQTCFMLCFDRCLSRDLGTTPAALTPCSGMRAGNYRSTRALKSHISESGIYKPLEVLVIPSKCN